MTSGPSFGAPERRAFEPGCPLRQSALFDTQPYTFGSHRHTDLWGPGRGRVCFSIPAFHTRIWNSEEGELGTGVLQGFGQLYPDWIFCGVD